MSIALTRDVGSASAKTFDGSDHKQWNHSIMTVATTNNGTIQSCVSVHNCKYQLLDQFLTHLANSFTYTAVYDTTAMESMPLKPEIKFKRTSQHILLLYYKHIIFFSLRTILYTNKPPRMYPSAREALVKKIDIWCV